MIYLFKIIAGFLLPPGILIIALIIINMNLSKHKQQTSKALWLVIALFYLFSTNFAGESLMRSLESRYSPPVDISGDVIVMLGGGATLDTPDIDGLGNLSGNAANRLLTGARLQRQLGVPIIISGGQVFDNTGKEAVIAKRVLLGLGIAEDKIIVEDASLNTIQNAVYVKKIMSDRGLGKPILVTSAFHMERSVLNFQKQGVEVQPYPADYVTSRKAGLYVNNLIPSAGGVMSSSTFFREWLGILAARMVN